jgi:uncharacterized coiled-coil protein SlyX
MKPFDHRREQGQPEPMSEANGDSRITEDLDAVLDEAAKEGARPKVAEITPERAALRDAMALHIRECNRLALEARQAEEEVASLQGSITVAQKKLDRAEALFAALTQKLNDTIAAQRAVCPLFLGEKLRSPTNPAGLTLDLALAQNLDGLKDAVGT